MDARALKFALPAALAVTTFSVAGACGDNHSNNDGHHVEEYCEDIGSMAACATEPGCGWDTQYDECVNTCYQITDEAQCAEIDRCVWDAGAETTGGGESCHQPFT